jgi:hypothetical protein
MILKMAKLYMQIKFIIPVPSYTSVKAISAEKELEDYFNVTE